MRAVNRYRQPDDPNQRVFAVIGAIVLGMAAAIMIAMLFVSAVSAVLRMF
jgi:hypothetical protein